MVGDFAHILEILGDVGDQMPGFLVVEIAEGKLVQMIESLAAHVGFDADAQRVAPISHDRHQRGVEQINDQQPARHDENPEPVLARQKLIDIELDDHGEAEFEQTHQDCAAEIEGKQALIGGIIGEETAQHIGSLLEVFPSRRLK